MYLKPTDAGLRLAVGLSGSGKTHSIKDSVDKSAPFFPIIAVDRCFEWNDSSPDVVAFRASTVRRARELIDGQGAQLVVVRPAGGLEGAIAAVDEACEWACEDRDVLRGVAIPEAHMIAPMGSRLSESMDALVNRWRHHNAAAWIDSQRLAKLQPDITQQAFGGEVRLFAMRGPRDLATLREHGGRELEAGVVACYDEHFALALACCTRGCELCAPERGWHVTAGAPPYVPRRG